MSWEELDTSESATKRQRACLHKLFALFHDHPELVAQFSKDDAGQLIAVFAKYAEQSRVPCRVEDNSKANPIHE